MNDQMFWKLPHRRHPSLQVKSIAMMDVFRHKTESLFLICDFLEGFSTGSISLIYVFSVLSVFSVSFGTSLLELASPALIINSTI
jgi:hypothetical protein